MDITPHRPGAGDVVVRTETVDLGHGTDGPNPPGGSAALTAYVARPEGEGPWPGVVLLHEVFGLREVTKVQARHLASLGYVVAAPDLFADGGLARCLVPTFRAALSGRGRAYADVETTRRWLLSQADVGERIGVIGFCLGGAFALMTATRGFDASAPCYGQLPSTPEVLRGACPVVASYGAADRTLPGAAAKLERALTAYDVPHDVKEYPGAGHRFLNPYDDMPGVFAPIERVFGMGPEPAAAADAWARIDAFFGTHLRDGGERAAGADGDAGAPEGAAPAS